MPSASSATLATSSTLPSASGSALASGSRASFSSRCAGTSAASPIGMFTKNAQRQPPSSIRTPPREGPIAAAIAPVAVQIAMAVARWEMGNSGRIRAREVGTRIAPPTAWRIRAATRVSTEPAIPHRTEASRKIPIPTMNMRLRPTMSARRPAGTSSAAKTML